MTHTTILHGLTCPVCHNSADVELEYGEREQTLTDGYYPGSDPQIVDVVGCECREFVDGLYRRKIHRVENHHIQPLNIPEYIRINYDDLLWDKNELQKRDYLLHVV